MTVRPAWSLRIRSGHLSAVHRLTQLTARNSCRLSGIQAVHLRPVRRQEVGHPGVCQRRKLLGSNRADVAAQMHFLQKCMLPDQQHGSIRSQRYRDATFDRLTTVEYTAAQYALHRMRGYASGKLDARGSGCCMGAWWSTLLQQVGVGASACKDLAWFQLSW